MAPAEIGQVTLHALGYPVEGIGTEAIAPSNWNFSAARSSAGSSCTRSRNATPLRGGGRRWYIPGIRMLDEQDHRCIVLDLSGQSFPPWQVRSCRRLVSSSNQCCSQASIAAATVFRVRALHCAAGCRLAMPTTKVAGSDEDGGEPAVLDHFVRGLPLQTVQPARTSCGQ